MNICHLNQPGQECFLPTGHLAEHSSRITAQQLHRAFLALKCFFGGERWESEQYVLENWKESEEKVKSGL